jgi:hypothetical protein
MGDLAQAVHRSEAYSILTDYYNLRLAYVGIAYPPRTPTRALEYAGRYLLWAKEEKIDPRLFMEYVFKLFTKAHARAPQIASMRAKKFLPSWREKEASVQEQNAFRARKRIVRTKLERDVSRLRAKPSKAQEAARNDYAQLGRSALCMIDEVTSGYDPRSRLCLSCPGKYTCLIGTNKRYGFDVGALRAGVFSRLPPEVIAALRAAQNA